MIEGLILLASAGFGGSRLGDIFVAWENMGVFDILFPFLTIFALVFAILNAIKIFEKNRAVTAVLAIVVGLMAVRFNIVPEFFAEIFPRLGIALSVILVILILVGLFRDPEKPGLGYGLIAIGAIITVVVLYNTAGALGWGSTLVWREFLPEIITAIVFVVVIAVIVGVTKRDSKTYSAAMDRG